MWGIPRYSRPKQLRAQLHLYFPRAAWPCDPPPPLPSSRTATGTPGAEVSIPGPSDAPSASHFFHTVINICLSKRSAKALPLLAILASRVLVHNRTGFHPTSVTDASILIGRTSLQKRSCCASSGYASRRRGSEAYLDPRQLEDVLRHAGGNLILVLDLDAVCCT